jgi:RNA polymerase sigma-70 factor (ECF subfamily)
MHNSEDAEDAVQEAFLKAFQHLGEFREDSKFSTWLIRITLNQSLMKVRKQRRAIREVSLEEDFQAGEDMLPMEVIDWAPDPEQLYRAAELRGILVKTLSELRPVLRAVFVLRDIEGLSTAQTAEVLNLSQVAVKARLWRGRLQLRERLNKYFRKEPESARVELGPGGDTAEELRSQEAASRRLAAPGIAADFVEDDGNRYRQVARLQVPPQQRTGVSEDDDSIALSNPADVLSVSPNKFRSLASVWITR